MDVLAYSSRHKENIFKIFFYCNAIITTSRKFGKSMLKTKRNLIDSLTQGSKGNGALVKPWDTDCP